MVYHSGQDPTNNNLTCRVETLKVHETADESTKMFIQKKTEGNQTDLEGLSM